MSNQKPTLGSKLKTAFEKTPPPPADKSKDVYLVFRWWGSDSPSLERSATNVMGVYSGLQEANNALHHLNNQESARLSKVLASYKNDTSKSGYDSGEMMEKNGSGSRYWIHLYTLGDERKEDVCGWKTPKIKAEHLSEGTAVGKEEDKGNAGGKHEPSSSKRGRAVPEVETGPSKGKKHGNSSKEKSSRQTGKRQTLGS
jgi:hypothetical protein